MLYVNTATMIVFIRNGEVNFIKVRHLCYKNSIIKYVHIYIHYVLKLCCLFKFLSKILTYWIRKSQGFDKMEHCYKSQKSSFLETSMLKTARVVHARESYFLVCGGLSASICSESRFD